MPSLHFKGKTFVENHHLYSKQPFVEQLTAKRLSFLLVAKPGDHRSLYQGSRQEVRRAPSMPSPLPARQGER